MAQARTRLQLITAVTDLGYPDVSVSASVLNGFVNEEYKTIAGERRWEWLQATDTFPTVVGTFSYAISTVTPNDVRNFDALWVVDARASQYYVRWLDPLNMLDMLQNQPSLVTGPPQRWSVYGGNILLWPTPDAVYTATVAYVKSLGDIPLANDSDRPLLPGDYDTVLVWGAAAMMATRMHDWLGRDFHGQQRDRVLANMRSEYQLKQRQNSDEVEETGIWGHPYDPNARWSTPGW